MGLNKKVCLAVGFFLLFVSSVASSECDGQWARGCSKLCVSLTSSQADMLV